MDEDLVNSVFDDPYKSKSLDELLAILNFSDKQAFIEFYKYDEIEVVHRLSRTAIGWLSAIFFLIFFVGLTGNGLLIVLVIGKRCMRTVINIFNVSLALADLLVILFCLPFTLLEQATEDWILGRFMCKTLNYITTVSVVSSVLTITAIAFERHSAICHPLRSRVIHTPQRAFLCSVVIWCFTLIFNTPLFFLIDIAYFQHPFQDITYEFCEWSDVEQEKRVSLYYVLLLYFAPLLLVCALYASIVQKLWIRNAVAPADVQTHVDIAANNNIRKKKRATMMLMLVVLLYALCWLPYHIFILFRDFKSSGLEDTERNRFLMALFQLLGLSNSCNNPVVYGFMNDKFKRNIAALLKGKKKTKSLPPPGKRTPAEKLTPMGLIVSSL
ncbi:QRFP-like peptide receptor [Apostichopus japonicus]|uniref:QRFP-like peptide receptor n=1 Tax=Stichopus japonicus TaxID=307972 RepID=UPI003AB5CD12